MQPKKLTEEEIQSAVTAAITAAVDFCDSEVAEDRIRNMRYYKGGTALEAEEGRSKVVATKCRDIVRMVKPVLMRTFMQSGSPVEFIPVGQDDIQAAEQATAYVDWKFNENNGFRILSDVIDDALIKKNGIAKVYWDETENVDFDEYSNLVPEIVDMLAQEPDIEIVEMTENEDGTVNAKVSKVSTTGRLRTNAIAPENFFIDGGATSIERFHICGDTEEMVVGDLVEMGFDFEEISDLSGRGDSGLDDEEKHLRNGLQLDEFETSDPSMRPVMVTEAYMRMDIEGTGIPRLYQFTCAGAKYKVLDYKLADDVPYAIFEVDPTAHSFFGTALVDLVINDQDAATSLLRSLLDNVHITNNPSLIVVENDGNLADAMNNEIGGIKRARTPQGYIPLVIPSNVATTLPAMQYYDMTIEDKAGVSKSSLGMDANALQSTTAAGVNAAVQAASAHAELMARNLAEGGMRRLFKMMMQLTRQHASPNETMRLNGSFVPVDPQSWNANMDLQSRVGLGTGQKEQRAAALMQVLTDQQQIYSAYGPGNPIVTLTHMYNTRADLLELSGVHSVTRYYNPMNPETEQQFLQQMQEQQANQPEQPPDPQAAAYMQAEQMKAQARAMADQQKDQRDKIKMLMDDDFRRDEMAQTRVMEAIKMLGEYGIQVNQAQLVQEQMAPRPSMFQG